MRIWITALYRYLCRNTWIVKTDGRGLYLLPRLRQLLQRQVGNTGRQLISYNYKIQLSSLKTCESELISDYDQTQGYI